MVREAAAAVSRVAEEPAAEGWWVVATWEDLVTQLSKEDIQGAMVELLVVMGILVLPGAWGVLVMGMRDRALVTVALGLAVGMEQQGGVMELIKEGSEEETLLLVEEVPGVIVDRGTRIEGIKGEATVTFMM